MLFAKSVRSVLRCPQSTAVYSRMWTSSAGISTFRTEVTDPRLHGEQHVGRYYTIPQDEFDGLFKLAGYTARQRNMMSQLGDQSIMVRKPALEIISLLKKTDFSRPVNRFVIYGQNGNGCTFTMNHVLHYAILNDFLIVHVDQTCSRWFTKPQYPVASESRPGRMDFPLDSAMWLQQFRAQNAAMLLRLDLRVSKKYTWSLREETAAGDPLTDVIEHGISRIKHASDCLAVLLKELKLHANAGSCKIFCAGDLVNAFYRPTNMRWPDHTGLQVDQITIGRAFKKVFRNDWINGVVVAIVGTKSYLKKYKKEDKWVWKDVPHHPKHLLSEEGFYDFDPFIPIRVDKFTEKEIESALDFYQECRFLMRPESVTPEGREELKFLSSYNPADLYRVCSPI